ncbi:MAG TPA: hypothetical protein VF755_20565 [Catenuloplanes sp.]|jgi:hypothetical protein
MGTPGGDSNGWPSDGGPPEGLPELPADWGRLIIPDDPAALADEAAAVRRELRRQRRRQRLGLPARNGADRNATGLRIPLAFLIAAVLATLASVLATTWPGRTPPAAAPPTPTATGAPAGLVGRDLPALELVDAGGGTVALRGSLPAVILLLDGCACTRLISDTAAARPDLTVVTVTAGRAAPGFAPNTTRSAPAVQGPGVPIRHLIDPTGELRDSLDLGTPDGAATALLVSRAGRIVRLASHTTSVEDFRSDLARL